MPDKRVIVITGIRGYWGKRLARRLLDNDDLHLIGLDTEPEKIEGINFIQADLGNPLLANLLAAESVDTVCHLDFMPARRPTPAAFNHNVVGTIKLLGACARAGVSQVIIKSSSAAYGARPENPAFLSEDYPLGGSMRLGAIRDLIEIETFCQNFVRQAPDVHVTVLRFAHIIGPTVDSPMAQFLKDQFAPVLLGFDPMMQLIHEDDVLDAFAHAILNGRPGIYNIAAGDLLPLWRLTALAGKVSLPIFHPLAYAAFRQGRHMPVYPDYLRYPCVVDTTAMANRLDFRPQFSAYEAILALAGQPVATPAIAEPE
jgi:UDP-glucose 4-epimerase